ncbi:aldehyde dehydrogenase [Sulfitobacter sp. EhC04]|uniref:aldehyde dehydrogenase family protein n=1 Tax=Sulfitobacter sp. EhC04 TaxID=1849168 RepID=UPI0007F53931|nr:aldehyde dehydrogenase family protein [Sulfitobacter sp. EhC04]OAN78694.1 aldehyde dehydrogenase [Sulfitobacter sp. EhC04]
MEHKDIAPEDYSQLDSDIAALVAAKDSWAQTSIAKRLGLLAQVKDRIMQQAPAWVEISGRRKMLPADSKQVGEEWFGGPYAAIAGCNGLMETLSQMEGKKFLNGLSKRVTTSGQVAVRVMPHNKWDRLLMSGVSAEVWMQDGVTLNNLKDNTASSYNAPANERKGKVALVLGAGNISSIAPLDCFYKLFVEHQVVILKMNPVNDYLTPIFNQALKPLIDIDALRIVRGDGVVGEYLTSHPDIEEIHITGAGATHDAIVWGPGAQGKANKAAGTPRNTRRVTSELGAVCPTIIVPGPWTRADIAFQAEHIATQKLYNSGYNCIACQTLVLPGNWSKTGKLMEAVKRHISKSDRIAFYPGTEQRVNDFKEHGDNIVMLPRGKSSPFLISEFTEHSKEHHAETEVFGPALGVHKITAKNAEAYLVAAVKWANENLHGTLGASVLIHPRTIRSIGKKRFESIISDLHYGTIGINTWALVGFSISQTPWGAFPGHTLDDVQSGIGSVHNAYMFDKTERTILRAPWRPTPRAMLSGGMTLLPRPPWFVTNRRQVRLGRLLTRFLHRPSWFKIPRIFFNALLG